MLGVGLKGSTTAASARQRAVAAYRSTRSVRAQPTRGTNWHLTNCFLPADIVVPATGSAYFRPAQPIDPVYLAQCAMANGCRGRRARRCPIQFDLVRRRDGQDP